MKKPAKKRRRRVARQVLSGVDVAFTIDAIDAADQLLDLIVRASADEQPCGYPELTTFIQDHALVPARIRLCQVLGTALMPGQRRAAPRRKR